MANIKVNTISENGGWEFKIVVEEESSRTKHRVRMEKDFYENLETEIGPEEVVQNSFEFLLEREAKEMILSEFNITVIGKYFPEFEEEIKKRINN